MPGVVEEVIVTVFVVVVVIRVGVVTVVVVIWVTRISSLMCSSMGGCSCVSVVEVDCVALSDMREIYVEQCLQDL